MTKKNTVQVVCVAEFRALEGKTDALIAALHSLIKATTAEPGCIRYELNQRVDDRPVGHLYGEMERPESLR